MFTSVRDALPRKSKKDIKRDYLGGDLKWTGFAALTWRLPNKYLQVLGPLLPGDKPAPLSALNTGDVS